MKILQLRFKNLNSLVGEWLIDFTSSAYVADGIFAIVGPTGAGKSTILDAICLALYGRTPRLGKITKSSNEIMSRQCGECFSEVTFETQKGRYRCHFSQRRARQKPDGELQLPKHEIANAETEEVFETKIKGVAEEIEAATGLDFDRFTRSILLAQGGFAAFLKATGDERAPILEQITGTEIYSKISILTHERCRLEEDNLKLLLAEIKSVDLLSQELEDSLRQDLEREEKAAADLAEKLAKTLEALKWLNNIEILIGELNSLSAEEAAWQEKILTFEPARERLDLAQKASILDGPFARLKSLREEQVKDESERQKEELLRPNLQLAKEKAMQVWQELRSSLLLLKEEEERSKPIWREMRSLDQQIATQKKDVEQSQKEAQKLEEQLGELIKSKGRGELKIAKSQKDLAAISDYLQRENHDQWLVGGLAGLRAEERIWSEKLLEIDQKKKVAAELESSLKSAEVTFANCQGEVVRQRKERDAISAALQKERKSLACFLGERTLREYRAEKEFLLRELALLAKIASLTAERAQLISGQACPLCGALEHPFACGQTPLPDEKEKQISQLTAFIERAEELENVAKEYEKSLSLAEGELISAEKNELAAEGKQSSFAQSFQDLNSELNRLTSDLDAMATKITQQLKPWGFELAPGGNFAFFLAQLQGRLEKWQEAQAGLREIEGQLSADKLKMENLLARIESQAEISAKEGERLKQLSTGLEVSQRERQNKFGSLEPNAEEMRLNQLITSSEKALAEAHQKQDLAAKDLAAAEVRLETLRRNLALRQPELNRATAEFTADLSAAGFLGEDDFLAACLPPSERAKLAAEAKNLDEGLASLKGRGKDKSEQLAQEKVRQVTTKTVPELQSEAQSYKDLQKEKQESIIAVKLKLAANDKAKLSFQAKEKELAKQKVETGRWLKLHTLIGSADGKKFRNFAQGLAFDSVIAHANRQLRKMTDRYLLLQSQTESLELLVLDSYQAGEIRSTKTLSGGESFIVSLALALGLSQMASQKVRVDSLFLDEGFGTLDSEALETALGSLATLQQENKLIGVISHLPALQERINAQIKVLPRNGGQSTLSGPGCSGDF